MNHYVTPEHIASFSDTYVPSDWAELDGKKFGVVTPPVNLSWRPNREKGYDLSDRTRTKLLLTDVISNAHSAADMHYINAETVQTFWNDLRIAPTVRRGWEAAFPELLSKGYV